MADYPEIDRPEIWEMSICAQLGRCAYAVAEEKFDGTTPDEGCEHWRDCFGQVTRNDGPTDG